MLRRPISWLILGVAALIAMPCSFHDVWAQDAELFIRGDGNRDGRLSLADISTILRFLYLENARPPCADAADFNDDGSVELGDSLALLNFIFFNTRFPAPPYPNPGPDPTADPYDCAEGAPRQKRVDGGEADDLHRLGFLDLLDKAGEIVPCDDERLFGQEVDFVHFARAFVQAYPGQTGLRMPIYLRSTDEVEAFSLSLHADPGELALRRVLFQDTTVDSLRPEWILRFHDRAGDGYLAASVFLEYLPPFTGKVYPAQCDGILAYLEFDVNPTATPGELLTVNFRDTPGITPADPSIVNELSVLGDSVRPVVDFWGLTVEVVPRGNSFVRGFATPDDRIDLGDAIQILRYAFLGAVSDCPDALDVNDDGRVRLHDAVSLLEYLFLGAGPPAAPFPNPGLDPTPDGMDACGS